MNGRKAAIIIPTWNNLPYLIHAVGSILELTDPDSYRLIVVSNGCNDGTVDWLKLNNIEHVALPENVGYAKAINEALPRVRDCDFLRMDDDVRIVDPNWLDRLQFTFQDESIGGVGPISNYVAGSQLFVRYGLPLVHDAPYLVGFCQLTRKEAMDKIEFLDEQFGLNANDDLSLEIKKAGYRIVVNRSVFVHHFGATSTNKLGGAKAVVSDDIVRRVRDKWGLGVFEEMHAESERLCSMGMDPSLVGYKGFPVGVDPNAIR